MVMGRLLGVAKMIGIGVPWLCARGAPAGQLWRLGVAQVIVKDTYRRAPS